MLAKRYGIAPALANLVFSIFTRFVADVEREILAKIINITSPIENIDGLSARRVKVSLKPIGVNKVLYFYVPPNDVGLSLDVSVFGIREPLHIKWLWKVIKEVRPRILDIGSNVGYFPILELEAGARHVIAIEPIPIAFRYLKLNLQNYYDKVTLINVAVVEDYRDSIRMRIPRVEKSFQLNIARVSSNGDIVVKARNINDLVNMFKPQMIRMDIEGYEWRLLSTLSDPDYIILIDVETHDSHDIDAVSYTHLTLPTN